MHRQHGQAVAARVAVAGSVSCLVRKPAPVQGEGAGPHRGVVAGEMMVMYVASVVAISRVGVAQKLGHLAASSRRVGSRPICGGGPSQPQLTGCCSAMPALPVGVARMHALDQRLAFHDRFEPGFQWLVMPRDQYGFAGRRLHFRQVSSAASQGSSSCRTRRDDGDAVAVAQAAVWCVRRKAGLSSGLVSAAGVFPGRAEFHVRLGLGQAFLGRHSPGRRLFLDGWLVLHHTSVVRLLDRRGGG